MMAKTIITMSLKPDRYRYQPLKTNTLVAHHVPDFCKQFSLDERAISDLEAVMIENKLKKGHYLLKKNKVCEQLFFVNQGLVN